MENESTQAPGLSEHEITRVLQAAQGGDQQATGALLDMVYDELRKLAKSRMAREGKGETGTLQATALVHEAYVRLVTPPVDDPQRKPPTWQGRGHFFGAAALAMRRILVERARHRDRMKHGGGRQRVELSADSAAVPQGDNDITDLITLDDALKKLAEFDPRKEKIVMLRYFGWLSIEETAAALDLSPATIKNEWAFARVWLHREMTGKPDPSP